MIEKAIEKIKVEMEEKKDNAYIQAIGDYLLKQIEINKESAEKIAEGTGTITQSLAEVEKVARTKAVSGCAVMADHEVFRIVREFYKFEAVQDKFIQVEVEEIKEQIIEEVKVKPSNVVKVDFSNNLDDYL